MEIKLNCLYIFFGIYFLPRQLPRLPQCKLRPWIIIMHWMRQEMLTLLNSASLFVGLCCYLFFFCLWTCLFYLIKLCGPAFLQKSQYKNVVTGIIHEPRKLRLPDIFEFTLSALEPSSVFSIDTSREAASGRPVSWSVDSTNLFLAKNFVRRFCFLLIVVTCKH